MPALHVVPTPPARPARLPAMPPSPVEPLRLVEPLAVPADGLSSPEPVRLFVGFERQPELSPVGHGTGQRAQR